MTDTNPVSEPAPWWEEPEWKREIEQKLMESEKEALSPDCNWLTEEEVFGPIDKMIDDYEASHPEAVKRELRREVSLQSA